MTRAIFIAWLALILFFTVCVGISRAEPVAALQFKRQLIREVHYRWGLEGPVAVMAAQIAQESGWRPEVCSLYACGLTQFTPGTAAWIKHLDPELASGNRFDPRWAIRAMVLYDHRLYNQVPKTASDCDRWAFVLSSYNGGLGWLRRDVDLCRRTPGCDPTRWWGNVEKYSRRADWAIRENRGYPRRILSNQHTYAHWGRQVECKINVWPSCSQQYRSCFRRLASGYSPRPSC